MSISSAQPPATDLNLHTTIVPHQTRVSLNSISPSFSLRFHSLEPPTISTQLIRLTVKTQTERLYVASNRLRVAISIQSPRLPINTRDSAHVARCHHAHTHPRSYSPLDYITNAKVRGWGTRETRTHTRTNLYRVSQNIREILVRWSHTGVGVCSNLKNVNFTAEAS